MTFFIEQIIFYTSSNSAMPLSNTPCYSVYEHFNSAKLYRVKEKVGDEGITGHPRVGKELPQKIWTNIMYTPRVEEHLYKNNRGARLKILKTTLKCTRIDLV